MNQTMNQMNVIAPFSHVRSAPASGMSRTRDESVTLLWRGLSPFSTGNGLRPDDDDEAARVGAAGERLHRHVELLREADADRLAARREVDLGLRIVEARRLADV